MCHNVKHLNNIITVTARYSTAEISNRFQILLDTDLQHRGTGLTMALLLVAIGIACKLLWSLGFQLGLLFIYCKNLTTDIFIF